MKRIVVLIMILSVSSLTYAESVKERLRRVRMEETGETHIRPKRVLEGEALTDKEAAHAFKEYLEDFSQQFEEATRFQWSRQESNAIPHPTAGHTAY